MRLWSSRPGYANLTPSSSQPLSAQPEKGSAPQPARPRSATLDRIRDKKVSFAPDAEADDRESLLGEGEGRPQQQKKGLRPSFPSLHSNKRMSFSLDAIKLSNGKTDSPSPSLTRSLAKSTTSSTPAVAGKAKSAPSITSKAAKQADAVLCLISGQDSSALSGETGKPQSKVVSAKELNQLKSALIKPKEANKIIDELKKITVSAGQAAEEQVGEGPQVSAMQTSHVKGACLDCTDAEVLDKSQAASTQIAEGKEISDHTAKGVTDRINQLTANGIPSAGTMLGQMASSAGAFEALAGVTGKMIDASGAHAGIIDPPTDRMSILVYWWGYELVLPPPSIRYLASVHSVTGTAFTFLQALTVGGGVPELAPFIRYLSMYLDMEWKAIQQNDRGKGVVLAATWVLPVAVVPRPMNF